MHVLTDPPDLSAGDSSLFHGLSTANAQAVIGEACRVRAPRTRPIFRQGDLAASVYLLMRGKIKLTRAHPDGQEVIVRLIGPGDAFGAVAALGDRHYPVSAQPLEAVEALAWDGPTMSRLLARYPVLAANVLRIVATRMTEVQTRLAEQVADRVEQRLAQAVLRLTQHAGRKIDTGILLDLRISRRDIAELAGTTLYTASRIISRWQAQGLILAARQRLVVRDPHGLVLVSERRRLGGAHGDRRNAPAAPVPRVGSGSRRVRGRPS